MRSTTGSGDAGGRRRRGVAALATAALVAVALVPGPAAAQDDDEDVLGKASEFGVEAEVSAKFKDDVVTGATAAPSAYFLQLRDRPSLGGGDEAMAAAQQAEVLREARRAGADLQVRQTFNSVWNGLSVEADRVDVAIAARADEVVAVYPVYVIEGPEVLEDTAEPLTESAIGMTGVDIVHETLGFTGEGSRIGIIDTGVDVDHPDFGGGDKATDGVHRDWRTDKLQYGRDFVGDDYNANPASASYDPVPRPDPNPDDCNGHGTHVAGIAAADGDPEADGVRGVAPGAVVGAYRVFGCDGSTEADIMLAAMEAAYDDGMDVINMSIGSSFMTWRQYPTAVAADAMADAGVTVVTSIGNSGANGLYSAGAPGVGEKVIGVASFDNVMLTMDAFTVGVEETKVGYVRATGAPAPARSGTTTLTRLGEPGSVAARGCTADGGIGVDLTGTVALIERGACGFHEKAANAQAAGADAVVLYNNVAGLVNPSVAPPTAEDPEITVPVVMVQQADGVMVSGLVADGDRTLTWTGTTVTQPGPNGGLVSSFSSYGLTAELDVKPDIGAPGGNIWSTYPLEQGGYGTNSGTSMAAPHVAGAAALLLEARPELTVAQVREVLQNSADPALWSLNPGSGVYEGVFRQGAGLLDVDDAIRATTTISPGKLALGEGEAGPHEVTLRVTNDGDEAATYAIDNIADTAAAGGNSNNPTFVLAPATMEGPSQVTVAPGATASVKLTFTAPDEQGYLYSGWVEFDPEGAGAPLRVPYAGYAGDYQALNVLTRGGLGIDLPVLGQLSRCDLVIGVDCVAGGGYEAYPETGPGDIPEYTLVDGDVPTVLAHLQHQARSLTLTAYQAEPDGSRGELVGVVEVDNYLARSSAATAFSAFTWDGRASGEIVPDGKYLLEVTALKPLGDPTDPDHLQTWTSEPFTIASELVEFSPEVTRLMGTDRYATAARVSGQIEPGVEVVYIAGGESFPDALSGAALAATQGAPVLLVRQDSIPGATMLELNRLDPQRIVVLGGEVAVSGRVMSQLRDYTEGKVTRLSGTNRYATAAAISGDFGADVDTVFVASGESFPDALAGAARAGAVGSPVLLVRPTGVPRATTEALGALGPSNIVILGGSGAISSTVADQLREHGNVKRLSGKNRYDTAASVAGQFGAGVDTIYVATGRSFPDALAGAARAGGVKGPVLLVQGRALPATTRAQLQRLQPSKVVVLGGFGVVSQDIQDEISALTFRN